MKPLLFLAADPRECSPFLQHWAGVEKVQLPVHWARRGMWKSRPVLAIANGAGPERARMAVEAAAAAGGLSAVCNIGFCGALDTTLGIGDVFVATEVNGSATLLPKSRPVSKSGRLASISRIAQTAAEKAELHSTGAWVVEMEAAGALVATAKFGVGFYCIRAVSDLADEDFSIDFNHFLMPDGRFNIFRLVCSSLMQPKCIRELIRLSKRTGAASIKLGEFLDHCDF